MNACGYRNRGCSRQAILFHCGGLDLHPRPLAHTNSEAPKFWASLSTNTELQLLAPEDSNQLNWFVY